MTTERDSVEADGAVVRFIEYGPHKKIAIQDGPGSGTLRISDTGTIDALREAFESAGWKVEDVVG